MLIKKKYKNFIKHYFPLFHVPKQKILKFHRSKWKKVQRIILKQSTFLSKKKQYKFNYKLKKLNFKDGSRPGVNTTRFERLKKAFYSKLFLKKSIQLLFFNSLSFKKLQKLYLNKKYTDYFLLIQNSLFKFEYCLNVLLVKLNFFFNSNIVKKNILAKTILVNHSKSLSFSFLKMGDIIQISNVFSLNKIKQTSSWFLTFLEVDYYTNTIVIIKDVTQLTKKDFFLLNRDLYNVFNLKDILFK